MLESCDRVSDFKSNQLTYVGISTQDKGNSHPNVPFFSLNDQYNNSNLHTYVGIGTQDKWNSLQSDQLPHKIDRSIDHNHNTLPLINVLQPSPQLQRQHHKLNDTGISTRQQLPLSSTQTIIAKMKQTCENDHTVIVNNGTFNGNINTTTINHYHISTVTPSCHFQSKETIQNDLQLDQSNTIAMDLLDLALKLMLQHVHCKRSRGDYSSYEEDCSEFIPVYSFIFCIASKSHSLQLQYYLIITRKYCRPC